MRIVVIASYAPSLTNFRGPLLRELVKAGHEVHALAPELDETTRETLTSFGVRSEEIALERTGMNPVRDLKTLFALRTKLRELRPDVTFAYTVKPVVYGSLAARLAGVKRRVAMVTGLGHAFIDTEASHGAVSQIVRMLYRVALRSTDTVIFHNEDDRALFEREGLVPADGRAHVVGGSGVDTEHFTPAPLPPPPLRFLLIARLLAEKGVREFVEAAHIVRERYPDATFELVGPLDSNPSAVREEEVARWVDQGAITYTGPLDDVREAIYRSHVYVLPSYREGLPRTNLEAMACGRPIITTDVPGCRQTLRPDYNGLLVPVRDASALAEACMKLIAEPALVETMGRRSVELVQERYSIDRVNRDMLSLITGKEQVVP